MRILNGISSVSLQSTRYLTDALIMLGHQANSVVYKSNPLLYGLEDKNLHINLKKYWMYPVYTWRVIKFFILAIRKYDIMHFHFGHSLLPLNIDLPLLKLFGKKVFMEYHGSEIRYKINREIEGKLVKTVDERRKKKSFIIQRRIARHVNGIIVHDSELRDNLLDSKAPVYILPLRLDLTKFEPQPFVERNKMVIVHAPSRRAGKGTKFVEKAVQELSKAFNIEFCIVENMSHEMALQKYMQADIVIDQLIIGAYGMFAIECMAYGKPVVCYVEHSDAIFGIGNNPMCNASIYDINEKLLSLLKDAQLRCTLGNKGRKYVERMHDCRRIAQKALDIYKQ